MKKVNMLKIVGCIFFMLLVSIGVKAQAPPKAQMLISGVGSTDTVINGCRMPYFVMPDAILNDQFNTVYDTNITKAAQDLNSSWTWFVGASKAAGSNVVKEGKRSENDGPYAEVIWATKAGFGTDTLYASEVSATGCIGDTTIQKVVVIPVPGFTVRSVAGPAINLCEGVAPQNITVDAIANNGTAGGTLNFNLDYRVRRLNSDLTVNSTLKTVTDTIITINRTTGANVTVLPNWNFAPISGNITEFTFAWDNSIEGGANDNGINDKISRKSDFMGLADQTGATDSQYRHYGPTAAGADVIVYRIFPAPNTGSIYYVPNNFNQ